MYFALFFSGEAAGKPLGFRGEAGRKLALNRGNPTKGDSFFLEFGGKPPRPLSPFIILKGVTHSLSHASTRVQYHREWSGGGGVAGCSRTPGCKTGASAETNVHH